MSHLSRTPTLTLTIAATLGLALSGCNRPDSEAARAADTRAMAESAAVYEREVAMLRKVGTTPNLQGPESAKYDRDLDVWFVANVNGSPLGKDNNGYISRLRPDGTPYQVKFIESGKKGVTLNAPKGMAINGDTLWVADIDVARAFNKRTGASIANVNLKGKAKFLNGATVGPDGAIYMTDTGILAGKGGQFDHPGPNQVFRITRGGGTVALASAKLEGPNGITWDMQRRQFVIVDFLGKGIHGWKPGERDVTTIGTGPGQQDGVEVLPDGRILTTSWADSSLFVIENGKVSKVGSGIPSPADIGYDGKNRVMVPLLMENRVELWELP